MKTFGEFLSSAADSFLEIFFPSLCVSCGGHITGRETICASCLEKIPLNKSLFCGKCEARIPPACRQGRENKKICHHDFPYILGAAANYKNELVRDIVREL